MMRRFGALFFACHFNGTFNLPDLTGRVPFGMLGEYVGQTSNGVLPNIKGSAGVYSLQRNASSTQSGALYNTGATYYGYGSSTNNTGLTVNIDASRSSAIYGGGWFDGTRVVPSSLGMYYIVKYV